MRYILTPIALLFALAAFSQHRLGFTLSSGWAGQTSSNYTSSLTDGLPSTTEGKPPMFAYTPVKESTTLGWGATLNYEFGFGNGFSVFSGIGYQQSGFAINEEELRFWSQYKPGEGFILPQHETYTAVTYKYRYSNLAVPLGINYAIPYKKIKFVLGLGGQASYLTGVKYSYTLNSRPEETVEEGKEDLGNYNKINFSALGNLGVEFSLFKALAMRVFSSSQYTFTNIADKDTDYKIHPYSTGLSVSVLKNL